MNPRPRVLNRRDGGDPPGSVYVGRPSKWGNPFVIGDDGDRDQVIAMYVAWLVDDDGAAHLRAAIPELRGKDLVCWCAPERCHADVLLELANA